MMRRIHVCWLLLCLAWVALGCGTTLRGTAQPTLAELRRTAPSSSDATLAGRWLFAELVSPGGNARQTAQARAHLDRLGGADMLAHLARGLDDSLHGRLRSAPTHYLHAVQAARGSSDPRAPFVAWLSTHEVLSLRQQVPGLYRQWEPFVNQAMRRPGNLGWRARGELVEWWVAEQYDQGKRDAKELARRQFGCVAPVRLAGPFGRGAEGDALRSFPAEAPGPWPHSWQPEPWVGDAPHVVKTERHGCMVSADEPVDEGVFYAETYLQLPAAREAIIAVQGAVAVWVDDKLVLNRDIRRWGVWSSFGTQLWLQQGRHRVLARLQEPHTSVRVLHPDGRPLRVQASIDAAPPYSLVPPRVTRDPNILNRFIRSGDVVPPPDDVTRVAAAYLAHIENEDDVASVLLEPLVQNPARSSGPVLVLAATFAREDPIFDNNQVRDLVRALHEHAVNRDQGLWEPRLALALWEGERAGLAAAARAVEGLVDEFPEVPTVLLGLTRLYGKLGWSAEYAAAVKQLVARFPETPEALAGGHVCRALAPARARHGDRAHPGARTRRLRHGPRRTAALGRAPSRSQGLRRAHPRCNGASR
jgi:hypothetical protein